MAGYPIIILKNHQTEVGRLALIFSMERRELSDELGVSDNWGYGLVSALYKKLGLEEILSSEVEPALLSRRSSGGIRTSEIDYE